MKKEYFFEINPYLIFRCDTDTFPFNLYIYNPYNNVINVFLFANSLLTEEKKSDLETILTRGGILKVKFSQQLIFCKFYGLDENYLPPNNFEKDPLITKQENNLQQFQKKYPDEKDYRLAHQFKRAVITGNFSNIYKFIREYVDTFKYTNSPACSLSIYLTAKLLNEDNLTNKVVALSFILAKLSKIDDEISLSNLICAAFFHHLGLTQIKSEIIQKPFTELNKNELYEYQKHPFLSKYILTTSKIGLNDKIINIITDHHERKDGSGFPNKKIERFIDPLSQILGLSSHIIEFSEGFINGEKQLVTDTINAICDQTLIKGLDLNFNDDLISILSLLYLKEDIINVAR